MWPKFWNCEYPYSTSLTLKRNESSGSTVAVRNSAVPQFRSSAIPQVCRSAIPQFRNSAVPQFRNSAVPQFRNSAGPQFRSSAIPQVCRPAIPQLRSSAIPQFRSSAIPQFRRPAIPQFRNSAGLQAARCNRQSAHFPFRAFERFRESLAPFQLISHSGSLLKSAPSTKTFQFPIRLHRSNRQFPRRTVGVAAPALSETRVVMSAENPPTNNQTGLSRG
jgi:hypothetical protein